LKKKKNNDNNGEGMRKKNIKWKDRRKTRGKRRRKMSRI